MNTQNSERVFWICQECSAQTPRAPFTIAKECPSCGSWVTTMRTLRSRRPKLRKGTREFVEPATSYLKEHPGWQPTDSLAEVLGVSRNRTAQILHRLAKADLVKHALVHNRNVWEAK